MTWLAIVLVWVGGVAVELVDFSGPHATRDECRERVEQMMTIGMQREEFSAMGRCEARLER